jgi:hypothetical protein
MYAHPVHLNQHTSHEPFYTLPLPPTTNDTHQTQTHHTPDIFIPLASYPTSICPSLVKPITFHPSVSLSNLQRRRAAGPVGRDYPWFDFCRF